MLKVLVEKLKYGVNFTIHFLLIPVTIVRFYVCLFSEPKPVTRTLRDARFCGNGHISGKSALQDGTVTDACGFLIDLTVEKGELVAILDGNRYVIANVITAAGDPNLHETLCDLWLPGPVK
ncbi:hypothetical protein [Pseudomonas fragi]|uniref:hypothetical protein n=1 Tax=Pseudomonas fragi TaxID=296 RepID=UPI000BA1DCEF|nr:hypothetical protein [Pseudomonas fragi]PAA06075.1 hypothetical protein CJU76_00030 [Pseudomonas fragi]